MIGKREQQQLNESKSFILDCKNEFYVWHGKKVSKDAKDEANFLAQEMWNANKDRAPWAEQTRAAQVSFSLKNTIPPPLFFYLLTRLGR